MDHKIFSEAIGLFLSLMPATLMVVLALSEWLRHFRRVEPRPGLHSILAVLAIVACFWHYRHVASRVRRFRQGRDGERFVAEYLESLRAKGFRVLHDVVGGQFNIDHVIVGPSGVFAIETKNWTKRRSEELRFDGSRLWRGRTDVSASLIQAKRQAAWLSELIVRLGGPRHFVLPVVSCPGWYVRGDGESNGLFVLNPKRLHLLAARPSVLGDKEIATIATSLEQFVRTSQAP